MSPDDFVLSCQRAIDRAIRRFRRGARPAVTQRRFLVVQIDGLSRATLEHGLATGRMPFAKRLLQRGGYRMEPMSVGLPTSTPAFQMAAFYGVRPDIPGFHYYNRERKGDVHFPRSGHAAWVESRHAAGRRGILQGGSAYGCCFAGGADNNFYTFTGLTKPSGRGVLSALSPFVVVAWVVGKNLALSVAELARTAGEVIVHPGRVRRGWRWLRIKVLMTIWVRNFFTMAVSRDLYEGVPAIYVNYLGYDEMAHAYGPRSRRAMQALQDVDRAIGQLWRVMRRVPEHRYDAYILSDHGQTPCTPYRELTKGQRLERWIFDEYLHPAGAGIAETPRTGLKAGLRQRCKGTKGVFQQFMNYLDEDYFRRRDPEAHEDRGVRAISAGPNAFLYVLDAQSPLDIDELEKRFPGLPDKLSRSPSIGFVLARSSNGGTPLCFWRGKRCELGPSEPGLFAGRADAALVVEGIAKLMKMPSAGDLVIYGTDAPNGHVSFIPERGAHAGPSTDEMQTFILRPAAVTLPADITDPVQLYEHFVRYQEMR
jgi:Type I phosphodiesterase / nucleotide pyrophosphatase